MTVENISIAVKATGADTAARHINSLANALKNLEKSSAVVTASSDLYALASALQRFSGISIDVRGISGFARSIDNLSSALTSVSPENLEAIERISSALSGLNGFRGSTTGIANGIQSLSVSLKYLTDEDIGRLEKISNVLSGLNGVNLSGLSGASNALRAVSANASGAGDSAKKLSTSASHASGSVRSLGNSAKHSVGMLGKLWASIKRIAFYRLLRTILKEISKGFQEGLKNAYAFSRGITGSLAQALDHLASVSGQMKNQMGAAFGELLQTIMPIIEAIVAAITRLMSALSALFAALGGRMQYLSAGENEAASWDKATGSANKYKNTILGFDEINRLNDEQGGGGGGADGDPGVWQLSDLPDWAQKIKDAIGEGDWRAAGDALADHLNEVIDSWDAYSAGKKLGEKINNAIQFAYSFLKRFNFEKLGKRIAEFFNGALSEIDTETLGRTLVRVVTGAIDFLIGFFTNIDTLQLGQKIADFISGAFNEAVEWLGSKNWSAIATLLSYKILAFFEGLDPTEIAKSIGGFLVKALQSSTEFLNNVKWEEIGKKIGGWFSEALKAVPWENIAKSAWGLLGAAMGAVGALSAGLIEGVLGREIQGFVQEMTLILSDAALVIGAILALTGANIPLGLGLMVAGVAGHEKATEDWNKLPTEIQNKLTLIEGLAAVASIAIGLILLLTGVSVPIGLGLLLSGVVVGASMKQPLWDAIPTQVGETLSHIGQVAGIAMIGLGIILLLTGVGVGFGLAMILAGVPLLAASVAFDLNGTKNDINGAMESVGSTGQTQFGIIATAILAIVDAVKSVVDWFGKMKTSITEVNTRLNGLEQNHPDYGRFSYAVEGYATGWASGGVHDLSMGSLFVAGEAGAEIVTNMGNGRTGVTNVEQMEAAVANGNINVVNAVYAMANMIVKAVNEIDPDITLDGQSLADKMYHYNQQAANRYGAAMVT